MPDLRQFLLKLTPRRALVLYVVAFGVGCGLLFVDETRPWLVVIPVIVYGGLLAYAQTQLFVYLNGTLKDSPYFLGFTLTLAALVKVFAEITGRPEDQQGNLVPAVGGAILVTIVGLVARHLLLSLDASDATRDEAFQTVMDAVRKNAADFQLAQQQLVQMVKEFTLSRETLFESERTAHARFVASVTDSTARLADLHKTWPDRIRAFDESVSTAARTFEESSRTVSVALARITTDAQDASSSLSSVVASAADATATIFADGQGRIKAQLSSLADTLDGLARIVEKSGRDLGVAVGQYPTELAVLRQTLADVRDDVAAIRGSFAELGGSVSSTRDTLSVVEAQLKTTSNSLTTSARALKDAFEKSSAEIHGESIETLRRVGTLTSLVVQELEQADKIAGQVISALAKRVEQLR